MDCKNCGNPEFITEQAYYLEVIVDGYGEYLRNNTEDDRPKFTDAEKPMFPIKCTNCGSSYEKYELEENAEASYKAKSIKTLEEYKGFQIDEETEAPDRVVIYDRSKGDYLEHEPMHSVEEAKDYIDNMDKSSSGLLSDMENLLKEEKAQSMEMDPMNALEEMDVMEAGLKIMKRGDTFEVHKNGKILASELSEKPSKYQAEKYGEMLAEGEDEDETSLPNIEDISINSWEVFDYQSEDIEVDDLIKLIRGGDVEEVYPNFYSGVSDEAYEHAKYIINDLNLEPKLEKLSDEEENNYRDELRYAVEDKMDFNIEQVIPTPILIYNPTNKIEISGPMYADEDANEADVFAEFGRQAGFSDEAIAECYSEATQGGMAKIGVLVSDTELIKKMIFGDPESEDLVEVKGEPLLVIHNEWNGSGYFVDGAEEHTFSATRADIADNIDSGDYSMGEIFGTDAWKS